MKVKSTLCRFTWSHLVKQVLFYSQNEYFYKLILIWFDLISLICLKSTDNKSFSSQLVLFSFFLTSHSFFWHGCQGALISPLLVAVMNVPVSLQRCNTKTHTTSLFLSVISSSRKKNKIWQANSFILLFLPSSLSLPSLSPPLSLF